MAMILHLKLKEGTFYCQIKEGYLVGMQSNSQPNQRKNASFIFVPSNALKVQEEVSQMTKTL